jgi:predicted MPP superfamily phosphohydrolase
LFILWLALWAPAPVPESFHFAILGDRTGEAQPGVYEKVLQAATSDHPAFVLSVGDTIQGLRDEAAVGEWQQWERLMQPFRKYAFYLAPGNHDVWSEGSAQLFAEHAGKPLHYSVDYGTVHITVLDNSRAEQFSAGELSFLEQDLKAHADAPVKFIVSHRPSWLINVLTRDTDFPLHRLARKYGVNYVVAGHVHEMLHFRLEGVEYVSLMSSGGHLRASGRYEDGWFFGYAGVAVQGGMVQFRVHGLNGRETSLGEWGSGGILTGK